MRYRDWTPLEMSRRLEIGRFPAFDTVLLCLFPGFALRFFGRFETTIFKNALEILRAKPAATDVPSSTGNAGASFVNLLQMRDGGMATVFTANQLLGGPDSSSTRPVVLKRSDRDQPAAHQRESRILQYLSRPGGIAQGFVIQFLEAYSTPEYNFIAMEQGGQNLLARVEESKALPASERKTKLELWGHQACQVRVCAMLSNTPFWGLQGIFTSLHRGQYAVTRLTKMIMIFFVFRRTCYARSWSLCTTLGLCGGT